MISWRTYRLRNRMAYYGCFLALGIILYELLGFNQASAAQKAFYGMIIINMLFYMMAYSHQLLCSGISKHLIDARTDNPQHLQVLHLVEEMCLAAGLRHQPKLYVMTTGYCNALSVGMLQQHYSILISQRAIDCLSRSQLQAVIAHEIIRIQHHDTRLLALLSLIIHWYIYPVEYFLIPLIKEESRSGIRLMFFWVLLSINLLTAFICRCLFRHHRWQADVHTVRLTRQQQPFLEALTIMHRDHTHHRDQMKKIYNQSPLEVSRYLMYFYHPRSAGITSNYSILDWFQCSPPLKSRLKQLHLSKTTIEQIISSTT